MVLGLSPTGLYAIRELGRAGVPVMAVAAAPGCASSSSFLKFAPRVIIEPDDHKRCELLLDVFASSADRPAIIPTSDQDIDWLTRHQEALAKKFEFSVSYRDGTARELMDKDSLYALCNRVGIDAPRSQTAQRDEISNIVDAISYPCLVKPTRIDRIKAEMRGRKGFVIESRRDLGTVCDTIPRGDTDWLVQEIVPGAESEISLCAMFVSRSRSTTLAMSCQKLRQFPPGFGSASLVRSTEDDETLHLSKKLLSATKYSGIAATEFKRDPRDGKLKIIEINPRPSLWFGITTAAGMPFALSHYLELTGAGEAAENRQKMSLEWRYLSRDLISQLVYLKGSASGLPPPITKRSGPIEGTIGAVFAKDDPRPALSEIAHSFKRLMKRAIPISKPSWKK